jgi:hypothetical protein
MNTAKPTQKLPENYHQSGHLNLNENRGLAMMLTLTGVGLLFGVGWLLMESLAILRPEYLSTENILVITGMREFWRSVLLLVVSLGLMIILNEGIRAVIFWIVTRQRPRLGFWGFYAYAAAPEWYLPKRAYLLIKLLPLLLITLLGIASLPIVPLNLVPGVMILVSLNFAGATGDMLQAWWLLSQPKTILVLDYGDGVQVFDSQE